MYRISGSVKTAMFWQRAADGNIECELCPHSCSLADGATGLCKVRSVHEGALRAAGYGLVSSAAVDPIEKKPLYHFRPGTGIFSIGGWGCNFACPFCQNWTISQQVMAVQDRHDPDSMIARASSSGAVGMAYTYNEPIVGFEFVLACAERAANAGLANVLVTNGYVQSGPAAQMLPLIDAVNVDIKSMDETFYREQCRARLGPVLEFARQARAAGVHVEVTNLVIPGLNDSLELLDRLAVWINENLGDGTPLHLSAYRPQYKMTNPATATGFLEEAHATCRNHLSHVYLGNTASAVGRDTECSSCATTLIGRRGYVAELVGLDGSCCSECGTKLAGVF